MSKNNPMPTACVIIIGDEILSGRTSDANLSYLGKRMDEIGIRLIEARVIPDDEQTIVQTLNQCRHLFTYVFTTGGIGPTHDDITAASVAKAFNVEIERNLKAVKAMDDFYPEGKLNDARLKMADIPVGATLIDNPVSGAPGFQIENIFVLPGVPMILQGMLDGMIDRLTGGEPMLTVSLATDLTEGNLAKGLGQIQDNYSDISIGSYPYFKDGKFGVNLVSRSTSSARLEQLQKELKYFISKSGGNVLLNI